jgi:membrane-associated phospholipid phosphatase
MLVCFIIMEKIKAHYQKRLADRDLLISSLIAIVFLALSLVINFFAGVYSLKSASNSVTDIILSNIRPYELDDLFVYGSLFFFFFILYLCLYKPERIPFTVKSLALFIIIRSFFTTLTHLAPFPSVIEIHSDILSKLSLGADLFFSGHTGMPFLLALIFWHEKNIRNIFMLFSISFAIIVLLAHLHYSIDVMAAYFITYTIFHIATYLFPNDKKRLEVTI